MRLGTQTAVTPDLADVTALPTQELEVLADLVRAAAEQRRTPVAA